MGIYDVDEMLVGTDPRLLYEWQAFYQIEPFGDVRADIRNAFTCLTIADAMGMKKSGGKFKLTDFIPNFEQASEPSTDPMKAQSVMKRLYGNNSKSGS